MLRHAATTDLVFLLIVHGNDVPLITDAIDTEWNKCRQVKFRVQRLTILVLVPCGSGFGFSFNVFFGAGFEIGGPNKRVDLVYQKSGRSDSRAEKSSRWRAFLSRDGVTGGARVAEFSTAGRSLTATVPRNVPCNPAMALPQRRASPCVAVAAERNSRTPSGVGSLILGSYGDP